MTHANTSRSAGIRPNRRARSTRSRPSTVAATAGTSASSHSRSPGAPARHPLPPPPHRGREALDAREEIGPVEEGGLNFDLGDLGWAFTARALAPEAAHDREVALETRHHQQLLEELGGLGQRVEAA